MFCGNFVMTLLRRSILSLHDECKSHSNCIYLNLKISKIPKISNSYTKSLSKSFEKISKSENGKIRKICPKISKIHNSYTKSLSKSFEKISKSENRKIRKICQKISKIHNSYTKSLSKSLKNT